MLLFSNLNPFPEYNPVTTAELSFSIKYVDNSAQGETFSIPMF